MTREELFEIWAPATSIWSQWTKPVLFAQMGRTFAQPVPIPPALPDWRTSDVSFAPTPGDAAMVVDTPGATSLAIGLSLAQRGYRPVPLFNACLGSNAISDLSPLLRALEQWAGDLQSMSLPAEAPPAFVIDSERLVTARRALPGMFDNRWVVFPQDFPSANFLLSRGIRRAQLVSAGLPQDDLAHVLLRWQEAGIAIEQAGVGPIQVRKPSGFRWIWARLLVAMGLRRSSAGGFGARIPVQSSGGGYH